MIYQLKITSWAERSRGYQSSAEHYFGSICAEGARERHDLTHTVEILNPVYQDCSLRCMRAKPGEMMETNRFETRAEVIAAAREWMNKNAQPTDILVEV